MSGSGGTNLLVQVGVAEEESISLSIVEVAEVTRAEGRRIQPVEVAEVTRVGVFSLVYTAGSSEVDVGRRRIQISGHTAGRNEEEV